MVPHHVIGSQGDLHLCNRTRIAKLLGHIQLSQLPSVHRHIAVVDAQAVARLGDDALGVATLRIARIMGRDQTESLLLKPPQRQFFLAVSRHGGQTPQIGREAAAC